MAAEEELTRRGRPNYNSTLCLCLLSSLGVCLAFLPYIPLTIDKKRDVIFTVSKIIMTLVILVVEFLLIRFIRNKERFHQAQLIFWPNRCRHCAKILKNIRSASQRQSSSIGGDQADRPSSENSSSDTMPIAMRHGSNPIRSSRSSVRNSEISFSGTSYFLTGRDSTFTRPIHVSSPSPQSSTYNSFSTSQQIINSSLEEQEVSNHGQQGRRQHDFPKRHRSLVNVFNVFSLIALFGIPFLIINKFTCIFFSDGPSAKLIVGEIYDLVLLSLIPVAMMFSTRYYDAVFVTTPLNCYSIVIFLSGGIWISAVKLVLPIANLLGFYEMGSSCQVNNTFGNVLLYGERAMTPFFTECAIISTGIIWQAWTSFVSRSELHLDREMPHYDAIPIAPSRHFFRTITSLIAPWFRRGRRTSRTDEEERELIVNESWCGFERYIFKCWFVFLAVSLIYFFICMWMIREGFSFVASKDMKQVYLGWSLEILFYFPYYIFFYHISSLSRQGTQPPQSSQRSLEGHDILLLLCTCGIFCQAIFRITAGSGLLLRQRATSADDLTTWIFSIIYSIFIIILIFNLTSFLVRVQRQDPLNPAQMKWVLTFLIYISLSYSTEWLVDSIAVETWPVQCSFFGETTGTVVGTLLDPFATLFGLHAAMVAHEAYKVIFKRALRQQGCNRVRLLNSDRND